MIKAEIDIVWPDEGEFFKAFNAMVDESFEKMAKDCALHARNLVPVKKGILKKSIRAKKSRFENGGWICQAKAPHAHLVEFGHAQVDKNGHVIGHVAAHSFLGPAKEKVIADTYTYFMRHQYRDMWQ